MTGDGFTAHPESFAPSAQQLRQAADQLTQSWQPVQQQSAAVHFGAGEDVVSPLIQVSLQAALSMVDSCVQTSAKSLAGYADGLEAMGRTYTGAEQDTTALMKPQ